MKQISHYLRMIAAIIGVILPITTSIHWPDSVRATVIAISGALLTVEHAIQSQDRTKQLK